MNTELCELFSKYGADKCLAINHSYSVAYYSLLKDIRYDISNVLEIGIGNIKLMSPIVENYKHGASLRAWSDFFPNAKIFGCDIDKNSIFNEGNIFCYHVDQSKADSILSMVENIKKEHTIDSFDLIIDDGSHIVDHMLLSINILENFLSKDGIYIIEDIKIHEIGIFNRRIKSLSPIHVHNGMNNWDSFVAYGRL